MITEYKGYIFEYPHKFKKEFNKTFAKHKCPTIKEDFKLLYDTLIQQLHETDKFGVHMCMRISGLDNYVNIPAFIIKKFRCKGINKGVNSGFRITFLYDEEEGRFIFVELFHKNKKKIPDKNRINDLFKKETMMYDELYNEESEYLNKYL